MRRKVTDVVEDRRAASLVTRARAAISRGAPLIPKATVDAIAGSKNPRRVLAAYCANARSKRSSRVDEA